MPEKHSSVGWRYRARLKRDVRVPTNRPTEKDYMLSAESMHVAGTVHPEPYEHAEAVKCAQERLRPLTNSGWRIGSLVVNGYDETEA